jgi:type II secretory pathway component PulK
MNRRRPTSKPSRQGALLIAALACMAVVIAIIGVLFSSSLRTRRQLHAERDLRQVELLVDAGLRRAAAKLSADESYDGETWRIPADQLLHNGAAEVTITLAAPEGAEDSSDNGETVDVTISARYPLNVPRNVQRTRTFTIQSTSN